MYLGSVAALDERSEDEYVQQISQESIQQLSRYFDKKQKCQPNGSSRVNAKESPWSLFQILCESIQFMLRQFNGQRNSSP